MKKLLALLILALTLLNAPKIIDAATILFPIGGGTGTSTPSGILYGDNGASGHLNTVSIGSNLTFIGGVLNAIANSSWATTSSNYWLSTLVNPLTVGSINATNTSATSTFTNLTASNINGTFVIDGTTYAMTSTGINAALSAAQASSTIYIRNGDVTMTAPVSLSGKNNITILCESPKVVFKIPQANLSAFGFSYMFTGGNYITIKGCTFDGGYSGYTAPPGSQGGGIAPTLGWTIEGNFFKNFNYFPIWLGTSGKDIKILKNDFAGPGRGMDNIGGGGSNNVEIAQNTFESDISGNAWDNTGGQHFKVHDNFIYGNGSFYVEAMQFINVHDNTFTGTGGINAQSDSGYGPNIATNSNNVSIDHNTIIGGGAVTITLYSSSSPLLANGGNISVTNNTIGTSSGYAVLIHGDSTDPTEWGSNYIISNNTILNPNSANNSTQNTGYGVSHPSGINVEQGMGVAIEGNTITDNRGTHFMRYGIEVGQSVSPSALNEPNKITILGNRITGGLSGDINRISSTYTTDYSQLSDNVAGFSTPNRFVASSTDNPGLQVGDGSTGFFKIGDGTFSKAAGGYFTLGSGLRLSGGDGLTFGGAQVNSYTISTDSFLAFDTSGSAERMRLLGNGNFGVGTTSPGTLFSVGGVVNLSSVLSTFYSPVRAPIQDQGGQVYNVKAYGAVCDGSNDDTQAINLATSSMPSQGGTLLFPAGVCITSYPIQPPQQSVVMGSYLGSTVKLKNSSNSAVFVIKANHIIMQNLYIDGNSSNQSSGDGIQIIASFHPIFDKVYINNPHDTGFKLIGTFGVNSLVYILNSTVFNAGVNAINIDSTSQDSVIENFYAENITGTGIVNNGNGTRMVNPHIYHANVGISATGEYRTKIISPIIEHENLQGIVFSNSTNPQVIDGTIFDNSLSSSGTYSGIEVGGTSNGGVFTGNIIYDDAATQLYGILFGASATNNTATDNKVTGVISNHIKDLNGSNSYTNSLNGNYGVGTSTPYSKFSIWGGSSGNILEAITSASSTALKVSATGFGTTTLSGLTVSGSATSTSNVGYDITTGCYAINKICLSAGGSGTVTSVGVGSTGSTLTLSGTNPVTTSGTINAELNLGHTNTWSILQNFNYSSTSLYASFLTASTTNLIINGNSFNNLLGAGLSLSSGALTIGSGAITNAMLAGTITVAKGGTGQSSFGQGWLSSDGTTITSSTSPTVNYITATSTSATSTFAGGATFALNGGNVGIGTVNPAALLHLQGANLTNTPSGAIIMARYFASSADTRASAIFHYNDGSKDELVFAVSGANGAVSSASPVAISQAKMVVREDGFVGISQTTPSYKLDVTGLGHFTGLVDAANFVATSTSVASTFAFNVGVGTSTPQWILNPFSSTQPQLALSAGANIAQWTARNAGGNLYWSTTTVAGTATTSTSAMSINGTTGDVSFSNSVILSSSGFIKDGANILFGGNGFNSLFRPDSSGGQIQFQSFGGSNNSVFNDNGTVGIATSSALYALNPFSATAPQFALSEGAGLAQLSMRLAGGNLYWASTTVAGNATTSTAEFELDKNGHQIYTGAAPACDANCSFVAGNDNAFRVKLGTSKTTTTVTFAFTWGTIAPICTSNEGDAGVVVINASSTPTTVVLTAASALTSKDIDVRCVGILNN